MLNLKAYESAHRWRSIPNFIYEANTVASNIICFADDCTSIQFYFFDEKFLWNTKLTNFVSSLFFFFPGTFRMPILQINVYVKFDIFVSILHLRKKNRSSSTADAEDVPLHRLQSTNCTETLEMGFSAFLAFFGIFKMFCENFSELFLSSRRKEHCVGNALHFLALHLRCIQRIITKGMNKTRYNRTENVSRPYSHLT